MATKQITVCDKCRDETDDPDDFYHFTIAYGTQMDAAGDSEELWADADFCNLCMGDILHSVLCNMNLQDRKRWLLHMNMLPE